MILGAGYDQLFHVGTIEYEAQRVQSDFCSAPKVTHIVYDTYYM